MVAGLDGYPANWVDNPGLGIPGVGALDAGIGFVNDCGLLSRKLVTVDDCSTFSKFVCCLKLNEGDSC